MNKPARNVFAAASLACGLSILGSGCFSANVGNPERFSKEFYSGNQPVRVLSETCTSIEPTVDRRQMAEGRIAIGLKGDVEIRTEMEKVYKTLTVERQRKLDFGLCPAWRETLDFDGLRRDDGNDGSLVSMAGSDFDASAKMYENRMAAGFGWTFGMLGGMFLMVPYALLVEPLAGDWACATHHWVLPGTTVSAGAFLCFYIDETGDKGKELEIISSPEFAPLGVRTYLNSPGSQSAFASQFTHSALLGFHKRAKVRVLPLETTRRESIEGCEVSTDRKVAVGPFRVHLAIPSLEWSGTADVPRGRGQAWFELPAGATGGTELEIRFEFPADEPAESTKILLETAGTSVYSLPL
jgi:hypothetical protein